MQAEILLQTFPVLTLSLKGALSGAHYMVGCNYCLAWRGCNVGLYLMFHICLSRPYLHDNALSPLLFISEEELITRKVNMKDALTNDATGVFRNAFLGNHR